MTDVEDLEAVAGRITALREEMEAAADALDFDTARRLRDEINLLRGGASPEDATAADTAGLERQRRGQMGLHQSAADHTASWLEEAAQTRSHD